MAPQRCHHLLPCFLLLLALRAAPAHGARTLATGPVATAPPAAGAGTSTNNATASEFLAPHNQARAAVGVPPLRWSADLAAVAGRVVEEQLRRSGCAFADMGGSPYGANQGWASYRARPGEVVASWVATAKYYSHGNNTCAAGRQCGTYTQVVWRRTAEVGCIVTGFGFEGLEPRLRFADPDSESGSKGFADPDSCGSRPPFLQVISGDAILAGMIRDPNGAQVKEGTRSRFT